jgi:hypothetical protein
MQCLILGRLLVELISRQSVGRPGSELGELVAVTSTAECATQLWSIRVTADHAKGLPDDVNAGVL